MYKRQVFELLGGAFILATLKMYGDDSLNYGVLLNSNKALEVIMGIFSSVIIDFVLSLIHIYVRHLEMVGELVELSLFYLALVDNDGIVQVTTLNAVSYTHLAVLAVVEGENDTGKPHHKGTKHEGDDDR